MFGWFKKKPAARFRIVQLPHDGRFWVQEFGYRTWMNRVAFVSQNDAEAWVEREIAGDKVVKEYRTDG